MKTKTYHLAVGEFPICCMGMAYSRFICGHPTAASAKRELERIKKDGPTNARVVTGECPKSNVATVHPKRPNKPKTIMPPKACRAMLLEKGTEWWCAECGELTWAKGEATPATCKALPKTSEVISTSHTPAPWTIGIHDGAICDANGFYINQLHPANAALIRAAPELLEMLKAATAYVELYTRNGVREQPEARYILPNGEFDAEAIARDARAIIANAEAK